MKAALYSRVSTEEQAKEGYSIEAQRERGLKFIESQGWDLFDTFVDDGFSAKNLDRPEIQRLIKLTKQKKFDVIVFWKLDRLIRNVPNLHELLELFEKYDVKIKSVTEIFDTTTAMGRFFLTLVAAMAAWERETIAERVVEGMRKKASGGERSNGSAPFGYVVEDGRLVVNSDEAHIVKELYNMYANGKGLRDCTVFMNQLGAAKRGQKSPFSVNYMLSNPVYIGHSQNGVRSEYNDYSVLENTHEPIIDIALFEKVQRIRQDRSKKGKAATSAYHFSGTLRCARCGRPLSGATNRHKNKYYQCIGRSTYKECDLPHFYEETLTNEFIHNFTAEDPAQVLSLIQSEQLDFDQEDRSELITQIETELASIKKRKKKWILALGNELISDEEYKEMIAEDSKREKALRQQLEEYNYEPNKADPTEVIQVLQNIPSVWADATDSEKKQFINELFSKIVVDVPYRAKSGQRTPVEIKAVELRIE
jgi:site-specific DNA recombinase